MIKQILPFVFLLSIQFISAQYIIVDDQRTAQDLVENVLLNNTGCASVSNFSVSGGNFGNGENSYGYFNASGTTFAFQEGLVLSNGKVNDIPGPNAGVISGSVTGWTGLDATSANILGENNTYNATTLEFDFVPLVDHMSFEYIFASEEYEPSLMCTFSDVFGFLLKKASDPDTAYVNIALIPGTTTPVKVTTVHPQGDCPAQNEQFFDMFNGFNAPIDFQGQTVALIAESDVEPNETYHIKLIIADDQDDIYDSAVFLRAGSFEISTDLGEDRLISNASPVCGEEEIVLDAGLANSYLWYKNGTLLTGEINQILTVTNIMGDGNYSVLLDLGGGCTSQGNITIEFAPLPPVNNTTFSACRDSETYNGIFDLTNPSLVNYILGNDLNLTIDAYFETMFDYNSDPQIPIATPDSFETPIHQPVYAKVININTGCFSIVTIDLDILEFPEIEEDQDIYYCTNTFPTSIIVSSGNLDQNNLSNYSYNWSTGENYESISVNSIGDYQVIITNNNGCENSRIIHVLESNTGTINNVKVVDTRYPDRIDIQVLVNGQGNYIYGLDIDPLDVANDLLYQEDNIFENVLYGAHTVYVKDKYGCGVVQKDIILLEYPKFITPNGDGKYDFWNINNINTNEKFNTVSDITIFDRYGRIMTKIKSNDSIGWNGKYNGEVVPPDDYWFVVILKNFKGELIEKRGHFSVN